MKHSQQNQETVPTQETHPHHPHQTTGKVKNVFTFLKKNAVYFILAVTGVTAFFAHETIIGDDWTKTEEGAKWQASKEEALIALANLKEASKHLPEYKIYEEKAAIRDADLIPLNNVIKEFEFFGFKNFQQFFGEFGWALGLLLYSLRNLVLTFIRKPKTFIGEATDHVAHLTVAIFFIRWSFNRKDFLIFEYFAYNIVTVVLIVIATYLLVRYKDKYIKSLKNKISYLENSLKKIFSFMYEETDNKNWIKEEKKEEHAIKRFEVTDEIVLNYEECNR